MQKNFSPSKANSLPKNSVRVTPSSRGPSMLMTTDIHWNLFTRIVKNKQYPFRMCILPWAWITLRLYTRPVSSDYIGASPKTRILDAYRHPGAQYWASPSQNRCPCKLGNFGHFNNQYNRHPCVSRHPMQAVEFCLCITRHHICKTSHINIRHLDTSTYMTIVFLANLHSLYKMHAARCPLERNIQI